MVSFGAWTQDADFHVFSTVNTTRAENYTQVIAETGQETPFQDPVYPITVDDLNDAFNDAQKLLDFKGAWVEYLSSGYNLSFPNWKSSWGVRIWSRRMHIGRREELYNPPLYGSDPPEGVIGIDYENKPYDPEDPWGWAVAEVQTFHLGVESNYEGQFEDGRVGGGEPLPWSVDSFLYVTPAGGTGVPIATVGSPPNDTANNWVEKSFSEAIDMAPYGALESAGWTADLHTVTSSLVVGGNPAPYADTFSRYGWMVNSIRLNRWVRPPLYRWVYATTPYRRTYPRDDALAGGARRTYPPSKATQTGNRTTGGYL